MVIIQKLIVSIGLSATRLYLPEYGYQPQSHVPSVNGIQLSLAQQK